MDLTNAKWHKSTRSGANGDCVEVAENLPGVVAMRDSKNPKGGTLIVEVAVWSSFIDSLRSGVFDR